MSLFSPRASAIRRRRTSRLRLVAASTMFVAVALTGCASAPAALEGATADRLQESVLDVTSAASTGDYETALSLLSAVEADLRTAASAGQVSAERSTEIQAAITAVNGDLLAAVEASVPVPVPTREPEPEPEPTPEPTATATPSVSPSPTPDKDDKEDKEDENKDNQSDSRDKNKVEECKANDDDDKDGICNGDDDD